jgi:hypothetical protein
MNVKTSEIKTIRKSSGGQNLQHQAVLRLHRSAGLQWCPRTLFYFAKASKRNTESLAFKEEHGFYGMQTSVDSSPNFCRLAVPKKVQAYMLIVFSAQLQTCPIEIRRRHTLLICIQCILDYMED